MARMMRQMWWAAPAAAMVWWWTRNRRGRSSWLRADASQDDTAVRREAEVRGSLGVPPSGSGTGITPATTAFSTQSPPGIG